MAETRGLFENPKERECPSLEAVARGLVKTQQAVKTKCVL
jgi:hypothetical protein